METNLKLLRKQRRLTQIALQMHTGIDQALLSKFESGKRLPTTEALLILSEFYNVSIDYILKRTDNPAINR
ncbi:MAG: helix-turn-helix transcriptional regulator [Clostridia bacterium]|nr:helix-turn-helix transcriptional regulator [Clostridia bacterium]